MHQCHDLPHQQHHNGETSHQHHNRKWLWALLITFGFGTVELVAGWITNSLALLGDAFHMFSDSGTLALAGLAALLANRAASARFTYGWGRAEVVASLINALAMLAVIGYILYEAYGRLQHPQPVQGLGVLLVAGVGLIVNLLVMKVLDHHHHHDDLNSRAARLHVLGDLLGSIAAMISGAVLMLTDWYWVDPLISGLICLLLAISTWSLLVSIFEVIMDAVPNHLDSDRIKAELEALDNVVHIHDFHIWALSKGVVSLTAHVDIQHGEQWQQTLDAINTLLADRYGITHTTLQPECPSNVCPKPDCNCR